MHSRFKVTISKTNYEQIVKSHERFIKRSWTGIILKMNISHTRTLIFNLHNMLHFYNDFGAKRIPNDDSSFQLLSKFSRCHGPELFNVWDRKYWARVVKKQLLCSKIVLNNIRHNRYFKWSQKLQSEIQRSHTLQVVFCRRTCHITLP